MSDFQNVDVYSSVVLVDRLGLGGKDAEFMFDGIPFPFVDDDGQVVTEKAFPKFVAVWLFGKEKFQVWTKATETQPTSPIWARAPITSRYTKSAGSLSRTSTLSATRPSRFRLACSYTRES